MRFGQCRIQLQWQAAKAVCLREDKTRGARFALEFLHEHRKRMLAEGNATAPVFCDTMGNYLRKSNFTRRSYKPLLARAEVPPIRFHDLRHTSATLLLLVGENPKVVSERLGHASIEITLNTYSHVLPSMQKAAADKLEKLLG
ncbi:MAG: site-specific integrase [Planctomycetota bacterium]